MSSAAFVKMLGAYRNTIGRAYPRQDAVTVLAVFSECAKYGATTQEKIRRETGLNPGNLSKIINRACREEWIKKDPSPASDGTKRLSLTEKGRLALAEFESGCADAVSHSVGPSETRTQKAARAPKKPTRAQAKARSLSLIDEL